MVAHCTSTSQPSLQKHTRKKKTLLYQVVYWYFDNTIKGGPWQSHTGLPVDGTVQYNTVTRTVTGSNTVLSTPGTVLQVPFKN
jgi:hypothetical protein